MKLRKIYGMHTTEKWHAATAANGWHIYQAFFHRIHRILRNPGNLTFWIFDLSFCESLFSKSKLFWQTSTWALEKLGWVLRKMAKTWVFYDLSFFKMVKKSLTYNCCINSTCLFSLWKQNSRGGGVARTATLAARRGAGEQVQMGKISFWCKPKQRNATREGKVGNRPFESCAARAHSNMKCSLCIKGLTAHKRILPPFGNR